ncbi:MAG: rhomboid family intramembrane serine protease [Desulfobacterales bacterium]|nr:MAG: rhomboid family intramembrane serine protease [Desulfobacterales bacterium]
MMRDLQRRSILCPNCRKLVSFDEARCPYCGISRPGAWWKNNLWTRGFNNSDQLIRTIIYVNVAMYAISLLLYPQSSTLSLNPLFFLSPGDTSLLVLGATGTIPIDRFHRWWTIVSASYLHGGILHILFNMAAFRQLAALVIREYGVYRMFLLYTLGGIVGFLISYLANVRITIGASAAVCGLVGASLYYGKSRGGIYGRAIYKQISGWVMFLFIFGLLVPGINNWGHGGGILAGAAFGFLLGYQEKKKENLGHKILAGGCAVLTLSILAWAVFSGIYYRLTG